MDQELKLSKYEVGYQVRIVKNNSVDSKTYDKKEGVVTKKYFTSWTESPDYGKKCGYFSYYIKLDDGGRATVWENDLEDAAFHWGKSILPVDHPSTARLCSIVDNGTEYRYILEQDIIRSTYSSLNEPMKINPIVEASIDADTKALIEAGYLDYSLMLTGKANDALVAINFAANKKALVDAANAELAEKKNK